MMMKARAEKKKNCENCNARFGLRTHKHTCKRCGSIICSDCSKQKIQILSYSDKKPHKICLNCTEDLNHNTNLQVTGKLQWNNNSNIMKQWLKNINTTNMEDLQESYNNALSKSCESQLTKSPQFDEYLSYIDRVITNESSTKYFNQSFLEMLHSVWGTELADIARIRGSLCNLIKAFFSDFSDQDSDIVFKQEYVDMGAFLLIFGTEWSAWRVMKEIYGIIIPMDSVAHIPKNDFSNGEKHLLNFLLDKIRYSMDTIECSNIYQFIVDRGLQYINSFLINNCNFSTSYQIFNLIINMPYNRRWTELLRSFGVFIIVNEEIIGGSGHERENWEETRASLHIQTTWKRLKEKMDVHCLFQISDPRQMSRFSMIEDLEGISSDASNSKVFVDDVIEENKLLKKEVLQIFKVKQLIVEKMNELDEMRMELQKRELFKDQFEAKSKELETVKANLSKLTSSFNLLKDAYAHLQEKVKKSQQKKEFKRAQSMQQDALESIGRSELLNILRGGSLIDSQKSNDYLQFASSQVDEEDLSDDLDQDDENNDNEGGIKQEVCDDDKQEGKKEIAEKKQEGQANSLLSLNQRKKEKQLKKNVNCSLLEEKNAEIEKLKEEIKRQNVVIAELNQKYLDEKSSTTDKSSIPNEEILVLKQRIEKLERENEEQRRSLNSQVHEMQLDTQGLSEGASISKEDRIERKPSLESIPVPLPSDSSILPLNQNDGNQSAVSSRQEVEKKEEGEQGGEPEEEAPTLEGIRSRSFIGTSLKQIIESE